MAARTGLRRSRRNALKRQALEPEPAGSSSESAGLMSESDDVETATSGSEDGNFDDEVQRGHPPARKRQKTRASSTDDVSADVEAQENALFTALSLPNVAVADLALEWLEEFDAEADTNTHAAITDLFNLVLRCCGCTHLVQTHDLHSEDSAAATVAEICAVFRRQNRHEYPFVATHKHGRHLRHNVQEFISSIVSCAHEKGALYLPPSSEPAISLGAPMMNLVVTWLLALSACPVRALRYVSTVLLMHIMTQLCELAASTTVSLQKQQRQLSSTQARTTGRNRRTQEDRAAILSESISTFLRQKNTVLEHVGDIFQHVFVHRYRDVDAHVRCECLRALSQCMLLFEEMFLRADYLRYIGWLLSDPADSVRLEAVRLLVRLYRFLHGKREAMSMGFRQFSDRFKEQFVAMLWTEKSSAQVCLLEVLGELFRLGFLSNEAIEKIGLFAFVVAEKEREAKTRAEACKFLAAVSLDRAHTAYELFQQFLEDHESVAFDEEHTLTVAQCFKYKALAALMQASYDIYITEDTENSMKDGQKKPLFMLLDPLFRGVYSLTGFQGQWEGLVKYVLCDFSAVTFIEKASKMPAPSLEIAELVSALEIESPAEKHVFLGFIAAAVVYIFTKDSPKKSAASSIDDIDAMLPVLIGHIPALEEYLRVGANLYAVFMRIWNSILITVPTSIARLYSTVSNIADYNAIHDKVFHYYFDMTTPDAALNEAFDTYLSLILKGFEATESIAPKADHLLNANIKLQIEDLLHSLATEGVDALFLTQPLEDTNDGDENAVLPTEHKVLVYRLLRSTPIIQKFAQIARIININRYVAEPTFGTSNVLLEVLQVKLISKFDLLILLRTWPTNYAALSAQLSESWRCMLEFILLSLSWKLEDLTYASNDNAAQQIDIGLFLDDFNGLLISIGDLCVTVGVAARELNETATSSRVRSLVECLVGLEHTFASHYIDMIASLRTFYSKFKDEPLFQNFLTFFDNPAGVGALVKGEMPKVIENSLKRVFFVHESRLALLKGVTLERLEDEDVNFEDFTFQTSKSELPEESKVWAAEQVLCVYTVKLYSLIHTGAFSPGMTARILLNSEKLGSVFQQITAL